MRTAASALVTFVALVGGCPSSPGATRAEADPASTTAHDADALPRFDDRVVQRRALGSSEVDGVAGRARVLREPSGSAVTCAGVTLTDAIAAAEDALGGEAVAVKPDDDGPCTREVMVLVGDEMWEAEVDGTGAVTETELADDDDLEDDSDGDD